MAKNYNPYARKGIPQNQTVPVIYPFECDDDENPADSRTENPFSKIPSEIAGGSINFETDSLQYRRENLPEINARIEKEKKDADVNRIIKLIIFSAIILISLAGLGLSFYIILSSKFEADSRQYAWSLVTLIVGAFLGFLAGKAIEGK